MVGAMLGYFFKILDVSNAAQVAAMAKDRKNLAVLVAERESYNQARRDLEQMAKENLQPDDFFTSDINFVKELEILEGINERMNVKMQISGIAGTAATTPKAKTITNLGIVPIGISISGDLPTVVDFVETLENLSFITTAGGFTINSADLNNVTLNLSGSFYIKK